MLSLYSRPISIRNLQRKRNCFRLICLRRSAKSLILRKFSCQLIMNLTTAMCPESMFLRRVISMKIIQQILSKKIQKETVMSIHWEKSHNKTDPHKKISTCQKTLIQDQSQETHYWLKRCCLSQLLSQ